MDSGGHAAKVAVGRRRESLKKIVGSCICTVADRVAGVGHDGCRRCPPHPSPSAGPSCQGGSGSWMGVWHADPAARKKPAADILRVLHRHHEYFIMTPLLRRVRVVGPWAVCARNSIDPRAAPLGNQMAKF